MKSYKELEREFKRKVRKLQDKCKHKEFQWMEEHWAPWHLTGYIVKVCTFCDKTLAKKKEKSIKEVNL